MPSRSTRRWTTCAQLRSRSTAASAARRSSRIPTDLELLPAPTARTSDEPRSTCAAHAAQHGRGRHLRPAGRRLLPLQRRRALDDPALREDALRQRPAAAPATPMRGCVTREPLFARVCRRDRAAGSCARCSRREGGYYSSLDADSEGTRRASSTSGRARKSARSSRPTSTPCSPRTTASTGRRTSRTRHWHLVARAAERSRRTELAPMRGAARLSAREALRRREKRVRPGRDEKILVVVERAR